MFEFLGGACSKQALEEVCNQAFLKREELDFE
jgi:hypothetical protein